MIKTILFLSLLLTATHQLISQGSTAYWTPPKDQHSSAYKIEKIRKADCTIVTYNLQEFNKTVTPRDDKNVGPNYFVSGPDCQKCFSNAFEEMKFIGEEFLPIPVITLDLDLFTDISFYATSDCSSRSYKTVSYLFQQR